MPGQAGTFFELCQWQHFTSNDTARLSLHCTTRSIYERIGKHVDRKSIFLVRRELLQNLALLLKNAHHLFQLRQQSFFT